MSKETQLKTVTSILTRQGYITRNYCLGMKITRLGALINTLVNKGMKFVNYSKTKGYNRWGELTENNDCKYSLTSKYFEKLHGKKTQTRASK